MEMDRVGIAHRVALGMFYEAGFNDQAGLQKGLAAINALPQAAPGYVYADDVPAAIEQLQAEAM